MTWIWRLENADGEAISPETIGNREFPSQGDAESWVGESWRELLDSGVEQVRLFEDEREVYGPMSLQPPE